MKHTYKDFHVTARQMQRDFMIQMIGIGRCALDRIEAKNRKLHIQIMTRFHGQPCRAAFWLVTDRLDAAGPTPLQQLAKDGSAALSKRLDAYVPLKDR